MSALIVVEGLTKTFGLRAALRNVSFEVGRGETIALLGPNGSGKTTLMRTLAALATPTSGVVTIGGWSLPKEAAAIRAQLGVVAHLPLVYDDLTAEENLLFFGELYGHAEPARIAGILDRVGLTRRAHDLARTFSRGMVQRLALARAMIHDPAVLLLDEPYTGLDTGGVGLLDGLLTQWRDEQRTVILSLHDIARAAAIASRALVLKQGKLAADITITPDIDLPEIYAQLVG